MDFSVPSIPMLLWCPSCHKRHIDKGEYATKPHHTHACQNCGMVWRPAITPTVGVEFLPGFRDEPTIKDACATPVTAAQNERREWWLRLDGVEVGREDTAAGWAVISGSGSEDPALRAVLFGKAAKTTAERLAAIEEIDGNELAPLIYDPAIVPAILVGGLDVDGGLFCANDYREEKAVAAIARAWNRSESEWGDR